MNIRQQLTEMLAAIREGAPVDTAKLAALRAQVETEEWAEEYAAECERTREAERAERERLANIATAKATVRDMVHPARDALRDAHAEAIAKLDALLKAAEHYDASVNDAINMLNNAGAPTAETGEHDPATYVVAHVLSGATLYLDGKPHTPRGNHGEYIKSAVYGAMDAYSQRHNGRARLTLRGGTALDYKLGARENVLPSE